ncbi:putative formin, FH2 domain-containing protein [Helianthus anomalus]
MFHIRLFTNFAGLAIGFKLDNLSKLTFTRSSDSKMTLMHYLCKLKAENMAGKGDKTAKADKSAAVAKSSR